MISYIHHKEDNDFKAHSDILMNGEYIGYFIKKDDILTAFIEINGEMSSGEFDNIKQLEQTIEEIINEME